MMQLCLDCGALSKPARCQPCAAKWAQRRGTGWARQRANRAVMERDGNRCVLCGAPAVEVDHVLRLELGGADVAGNKRSLCRGCHRAVSK